MLTLLAALTLLVVCAGGCKSPFYQGVLPDAGGGGTPSDAGGGADGTAGSDADDGGDDAPSPLPKFSFFYTSVDAMRRLSGNDNGFGGDLRFGETTGLAGADKICQTIATDEGFGGKTWKAFLSAVAGPDGMQVDAINRIGDGPWYDRNGRLIAPNKDGLLTTRPTGDATAVNDLPDEKGNGTRMLGTSYDAVTATSPTGTLEYPGVLKNTCNDWTDNTDALGVGPLIVCGHSWVSDVLSSWMSTHPERSCKPGVNLTSNGGSDGSSIGAAGGWGGFYCFATTP